MAWLQVAQQLSVEVGASQKESVLQTEVDLDQLVA